jgi:GNAT superfamily N-acetyltransferase
MLYEAASVAAEIRALSRREALALPVLHRYLDGWGRRGDAGVVAAGPDGIALGAAWYRLYEPDERGAGILAWPETPELAIGVRPAARGQGIGRSLLAALGDQARVEGYPRILLTVDPANPAVRLYHRSGFREVPTLDPAIGTSLLMSLELGGAPGSPGAWAPGRVTRRYRISLGGRRSTEELVDAGGYGYAHSCVTSENFPVRPLAAGPTREILLVEFEREVTSADVLAEAVRLGLERPAYEDALHFGIEHPDVQRERPVVFLHDPWVGFFGRRDVLCLWENAGRRELGLEGFDDRWGRPFRFAFVRRDDA